MLFAVAARWRTRVLSTVVTIIFVGMLSVGYRVGLIPLDEGDSGIFRESYNSCWRLYNTLTAGGSCSPKISLALLIGIL